MYILKRLNDGQLLFLEQFNEALDENNECVWGDTRAKLISTEPKPEVPKPWGVEFSEEENIWLEIPPTEEQLATQIRAERDSKIQEIRWRLERARDEQDLGLPLTEPIEPILLYIQELRDVPQQPNFPHEIIWPILEQLHE